MLTANRIIGIILIFFSSAVWYIASGFPEQGGSGPGTAFFPQMMAVLLIIISLGLIFVNPVTEEQTKFTKEQLFQFLLIVVTLVIYIFLIPRVGFAVTTLFAAFAFITALNKANHLIAAVTALIITGSVYAVFRFLFNVPLPQGILF
ncbi:tripartite tricarboxylate transporter TctB family protein [Evansella clarkii]|uniref:tripartite tricarboxylate transporter TctB family protein n=1 Tax=Evansella clarkii TaxID=79879 RepID=UPI000B44E622|nr:tripartite tricarboxylate transporter TctB family protein [Evansella clarkii]